MKNWKNAPKTKWFGFVGVGVMVVAPVAAVVSCSSSIQERKNPVDPKSGAININKGGNNLLKSSLSATQKVYSYIVRNVDDDKVIETKWFTDFDKALRFAKSKEEEKIAPEIKYKFNGVTYDNIDDLNKDFDAKVDSIMVRELLESKVVTLRVAPSNVTFEQLAHDIHSNENNQLMFIYNNRVYGSYSWVAQAWSLDHPNQKHTPELQTALNSSNDSIVVRIANDTNTIARLLLAKANGVSTADLALVLSPFPPTYAWTVQHPYNPNIFMSYQSKAGLMKAMAEWIKGDNGNSNKDPFTKINGFEYEKEFYVDIKTAKAVADDKALILIKNSETELDVEKIDPSDYEA